jgi:PAS domain S-box-containing protein
LPRGYVAFRGAQLRETLERERQELTAIVDGATDAIIQVDEGCRIVRINPAARQLLGLATDAAVGQRCTEVLRCVEAGAHAEDACPLAEVMQSGRSRIARRLFSMRRALSSASPAGSLEPPAM